MSKFKIFYIVSLAFGMLRCPLNSDANKVFIRNDPYIQSSYLTLKTDHDINPSPRAIHLKYIREFKNNALAQDTIQVRLAMLASDAQVTPKMLIFANNLMFEHTIVDMEEKDQTTSVTTSTATQSPRYGYQPTTYGPNYGNQTTLTTSTHTTNWKIYNFNLTPPPELIEAINASPNLVLRVYYGPDAADVHFNAAQLAAVKRYFASQFDKVAEGSN